MDELARRYAALVRLYPPSFRREHGAALLATLLDAAPAGAVRPPVRDVADLVGGAARAYVRPLRTPPARATWRSGLTIAADVGVALHAALGVAFATQFGVGAHGLYLHRTTPGPVRATALVAGLCALAALVALVAGRRRGAMWFDVGAVVAAVASRGVLAGGDTLVMSYQRMGLAAGLLGVTALALVRTRNECTRLRPPALFLTALTAGVAAALDGRGGVAVLAAASVTAVVVALTSAPWRPHRLVAVSVLLAPMYGAAAGAWLDVLFERTSRSVRFDATFLDWALAFPLVSAAAAAVLVVPVVALFSDDDADGGVRAAAG